MSPHTISEREERFAAGPQAFLRHLSELFHFEELSAEELRAGIPAFDLVPYAEAARRNCLALRVPDGATLAILGDPFDIATQDWLEERIRVPFSYRLTHHRELTAYLSQQERNVKAMDAVQLAAAAPASHPHDSQDVSIEAISETDSPVIRLVTSTLHDALKCEASDIHLETVPGGLSIKYRVDGVLSMVKAVEGTELAEQVISRIKVVAQLDIGERRIPQDGRFRVRHKHREIDLRVSIMPSVLGEDAVLRILDKRALAGEQDCLTLEQLGFAAGIIGTLRQLSREPHGMLLVTGPTGSGKTTTLYAVINEVNSGLDKIITIEDPVEYRLPGVLQIPVNEKKGLTFARGLRSILRHDPDRIMVGEIRDPETAEIAVQSALTGHLVYTTVHANNVFDVLGRFFHMGVDTFSLASALNAVMAQRLVRKLCEVCRGRGCAECAGTGYRGRKAIAELMILNDDLKELIVTRAPTSKLKAVAQAAGTGSLREAALELVRLGETTLEEIDRVTFSAR